VDDHWHDVEDEVEFDDDELADLRALSHLEDRFDQALADGDDERLIDVGMAIAARPHADEEVWLPELLDEVAHAQARLGHHDDAIATVERAIAGGAEATPDPRADIAEFHLMAGRVDQATSLYRRLRFEDPEDVWLYNAAGMAHQDVGMHEQALAWLEQGLDVAMAAEDPERVVGQLAELRRISLVALGQDPDDPVDALVDDFLARPGQPARQPGPGGALRDVDAGSRPVGHRADRYGQERDAQEAWGASTVAFGWFLRGELDEAVRRWPALADVWEGDDEQSYARALQGHLVTFSRAGGTKPRIAPLTVEGLRSWARTAGQDPGSRSARANYAAIVSQRGDAMAWPPGRNEPCWCGSGTKYKRCCGTVTPRDA